MDRGVVSLRRSFLEISIFSTIYNLLLLIMPLYMLQIYDRVLPAASLETLIYLSGLAVAGLILLGILDIVRSLYANRVAARLDAALGKPLFLASLRAPTAGGGDVQPLRDLAALRNFIASRMAFVVFDLLFMPIFIGILYLIHPLLFWITLGGALLMLGVAVLNQVATARSGRTATDRLLAAVGSAQAFARSFETIRVLGMTAAVTGRWGDRHADSLNAWDRVGVVNAVFGGFARGLRMALQVALLGVGAYLVLNQEMTAGMIFASSIISGRALQPLDQVIGGWRQIADAAASWRRVKTTSAAVGQAAERPRFNLPSPRGALTVEDVVYFIPGTEASGLPLIKRLSFGLPAGGSLAIVGPSQAGKSTLARLIVGAIEPRSGLIRLDGSDIRNFEPDVLGRHIGYLPQEIDLLPGTVAENIARFSAGVSEMEVIEAAKRANAHDLILSLSNGYATEIGPSGARLSGGERQRIGLARAFFGDPKLIVLDEPNSALDSAGESALEAALVGAKERGATVIVITHRISLAKVCDRTLALKAGQIEAVFKSDEIGQQLTPVGGNASVGGGASRPGPVQVVPSPRTAATATASFGHTMRGKTQ